MRSIVTNIALILGTTASVAGECHAQDRPAAAFHLAQRPSVTVSGTPDTEFGGYIGVWNLNAEGGGAAGLRLTRRKNNWLSWEVDVNYRGASSQRSGLGLAQVNARFGVPHRTKGGLLFASVGMAAGRSANFRLSPVIGAGYQSAWLGGVIATRVELQVYARGRGVEDRGRLLLGVAIALW